MLGCLTTLAANGDEKIPVSGLWKFVRYPFISGTLVLTAAMVLVTGIIERVTQISSEWVSESISRV